MSLGFPKLGPVHGVSLRFTGAFSVTIKSMTYSINTLKDSEKSEPSSSASFRFTQEVSLLLTAVLLGFWIIALLTHHVTDGPWSTSGVDATVANWMGRVGAWVADITYFLMGFSAWWLVLGAINLWRIGLLRWMRPELAAPVVKSGRGKSAVAPAP